MATMRQELAFAKLAETGGNVGAAMRAAGYSKASSNTPAKLLKSKGFEALMKKHLPDSLLAKVHNEGLKATKYESQLTGKGESEIVEVPDYAVRHKYLDTAYKIKSKYVAKDDDPSDGSVTNNFLQIVIKTPDETA